ncbi:MAG TPA: hypothetical protein VLP43_00825 [Solirubrobacteraceae bacterium]|nr:hypothetical protein [Solirubrobacteraceae bacterium]
MARNGTQAGRAARATSLGGRATRAWRVMSPEQRLAAGAAIGLFVALFLPWYQETIVTAGLRVPVSASLTGWAAFSWVEAAVLLVAGGVLTLLFHRVEGRAFHLPGGDGVVIMAAGLWTCALVVWRVFDKEATPVKGPGISTSGIEWGIFVALGVAGVLAYAGSRLRAAHRPEPPLPGEEAFGGGGTGITLEAPPEASSVRVTRAAPAPAPASAATPTPVPARPPAAAPARRPAPAEREPGWLSARPRHVDEDPTVARDEQLTIPIDAGDARS